MSRNYIYLDELDLTEPGPRPGRPVAGCNCAAFDHVHEPHCGWDIDDDPTPVAPTGPIAAMPYAAVPIR